MSSFPTSFSPNSQNEGTSTQQLKRKVPIAEPLPEPAPQQAEADAGILAKKARMEDPVVAPSKEIDEPLLPSHPDGESPLDTSPQDDASENVQQPVGPLATPEDRDKNSPEPWLPSALRDGSASNRDRTPVQMTLNTSGATWNLHKADSSTLKGKTSKGKTGTRKADNSTQRMKTCLQQFTRARGADVVEGKGKQKAAGEEDMEEDEREGEEAEGEEEGLSSENGVEEDQVDGLAYDGGRQPQSVSGRSSIAVDGMELDTRDPAQLEAPSSSPRRESSVAQAQVRAESSQWRNEIESGQVSGEVVVALDIVTLERVWARRVEPANAPVTTTDQKELMAAGLSESDTEATAALSRTVHQSDFATMKVIGQFNLGFIIAGLGSKDVVIVDQHASDEKYNFERLQRDTKLSGQRLLTPRVLDLPAAEELTAMEHRDLLELNGFGISVDEEAPVGERVKLVAQPESRDTVWGPSDLEELLHLIRNADLGANSSHSQPGVPPLRPSKTRKMLASRACRSSVMIGDPLTAGQMRSILDHMGTMKEPWACPHGRPTMRWLARCEDEPEVDKRDNVKGLLEEYFL